MAKKRTEERKEETKESLPVVTALSLVKGKDGWQVLTLKIQGDIILDVHSTEPNMRAIALEAFKIAAAKEFMS
jgi:hypothetical protein